MGNKYSAIGKTFHFVNDPAHHGLGVCEEIQQIDDIQVIGTVENMMIMGKMCPTMVSMSKQADSLISSFSGKSADIVMPQRDFANLVNNIVF